MARCTDYGTSGGSTSRRPGVIPFQVMRASGSPCLVSGPSRSTASVPVPLTRVWLRASATETDVTVALTHRAQDIRESYVPRRGKEPREARPKILRTKKGEGTVRSAVWSYVPNSAARSATEKSTYREEKKHRTSI